MLDVTPLLRLFAKSRNARLASRNPAKVQSKQLLSLVRSAAATRFGIAHQFSKIRSVSDYQERVPLRTYEQMWTEYWKPVFPILEDCTWPGRIPFIPVSSGTSSGTTKYIPCSREMVASNTKAGLDLLVHHITNRPTSKILGGRNFMLGGSTELNSLASGVWAGDLSGIAVKTLPWWAKQYYYPPAHLALLKNWEEKIDKLGRGSLATDIRMISGVPSWMLIFFDKLRELRPDTGGKIQGWYPNLEMIVHGGVNFAPYHDQFVKLLEGSSAELREVYPASEGFIAIADRGYGEGLRMNLDNGLFYEFVPLEELGSEKPTRHWIDTVQLDVNYAIIMTTCAGLWSYILGDTVKFIDKTTPRLLITGRTSYYLSAFGEHVIAEELEDSVATAARELSLTVTDFVVTPVYPQNTGDLGGHRYYVEFAEKVLGEAERIDFGSKVDKRLSARNEDYEAHRAGGYGLKSPEIISVPRHTFAEWMKARNKLGGQNKVPRIIIDKDLAKHLDDFVVGRVTGGE